MANVATTIMILVEIMVKTSPIVVFGECLHGALVLFALATSNYVVLRLRFFLVMGDDEGISTTIKILRGEIWSVFDGQNSRAVFPLLDRATMAPPTL